ncbi:putative plastid-lipid-associated protein 14, chloroplastic [Senna tora]|uniref:Putative plastid-lipid-associated protein 14, chloroplastic n=1 Tax=Senna tora TaxID=362788 RepID=A0A834U1D8_9FABA|nr:putative plastid-lipid-associated protein 14, chloroplastic [Senna tora]
MQKGIVLWFLLAKRVLIIIKGRTKLITNENTVLQNSDDPENKRRTTSLLLLMHSSSYFFTTITSLQANSETVYCRGRHQEDALSLFLRKKMMIFNVLRQIHCRLLTSKLESDKCRFILCTLLRGLYLKKKQLQLLAWRSLLFADEVLSSAQAQRRGKRAIEVSGSSGVKIQSRPCFIITHSWYLLVVGVAHLSLSMGHIKIGFFLIFYYQVGILGNAADFYEDGSDNASMDNMDRRQMMIAFDMRCVGFVMAKMVLRELMDPLIFAKFKSFLTKGYDPSCLRELMLELVGRNSPSGNAGLQILDRNWGAGWHLLSVLLATKPSKRISCLDALRHPFLCGPRWRIVPSMDVIRWGLGSTAVRITEEYIYRQPQRSRLAHFIELMEMLNPHSRPKNWLELLPGKWRLLYCTGKHIGLTLRQPPARVLIGDVHLTVTRESKLKANFSFISSIGFTVMIGQDWPHDKAGKKGRLEVESLFALKAGRRLYLKQDKSTEKFSFGPSSSEEDLAQKISSKKWKKVIPFKEFPSSLPAAKLVSGDIDVTMNLDDPLNQNVGTAGNILQEVRTQIPPEMFDLSKLVCGTYGDSRMLVLRGVNGSALLFTRSFVDNSSSCR